MGRIPVILLLTAGLAIVSMKVDAASILSVSAPGSANAASAESAFWADRIVSGQESFESFSIGYYVPSLVSSQVGTFSQIQQGSGGICSQGANSCAGLEVLSAATTPFDGRKATDGLRWLDSNDSRQLAWTNTLGSVITSLGFYITDPNDVNGRFRISTTNGEVVSFSFADIFGGAMPNGLIFYVSLFDPTGISQMILMTGSASGGNVKDDGYGIDKLRVGVVPLPATLPLFCAALAALGVMARRRRAKER